jgi:hypothetical protein
MTTEEPPDETYLRRLIRRERAGERATLEIGPYTAMMLVGVIQWSIRRPALATHGPDMFQAVLDQLKLIFIDDPEGQELIRQAELPPE